MLSGHEPGESLSLKVTATSPEIAFKLALASSVAHLAVHCLKKMKKITPRFHKNPF